MNISTEKGHAKTNMTERQLRRREKILSAARELIARHGYDGVRMRELAQHSEVTPKTLYHQFESKESLLRIAVEERFRHTYEAIDAVDIDHGIDRLVYIIEAVADSTRKNMTYAKALAPMLSARSSNTFSTIRMNTYKKAIDQIAAEGDFLDWIDVTSITAIIYRQVNPLYLAWWYDKDVQAYGLDAALLDIALVLRSITKGYTHERATRIVRESQHKIKGVDIV